MKTIQKNKDVKDIHTWEEQSGLLAFLSSIQEEVSRFNEIFEFGINNRTKIPAEIDSNSETPLRIGFIVTRDNPLLPEVTYCLYSILIDKTLHGYIGIYDNYNVRTLKQLKPIKDFRKGQVILYDWLKQLVRASCEKMMI